MTHTCLKPNTLAKIVLIALTGLLLSACQDQKADYPSTEEGLLLSFRYRDALPDLSRNTVQASSPIPALEPPDSNATEQEITISNASFFLYDRQGNLITSLYTDAPDKAIRLRIHPGKKADLYVVANVGDWTKKLLTVTKDGLRKTYWDYLTAGFSQNMPLPMSGKLENETFNHGDVKTLRLSRLVAKLRIIADTSGLSKDVECFEIKQIQIRNLNRRVGFFDQSKASDPNWIGDNAYAKTGETLADLWDRGVDFYLPENCQGDLLEGNTDPSTHLPPTSHENLCTYIEFTVNYRSRTHCDEHLIYRYYLHDGRFLDNFDLQRNTLYTCHTRFYGDGLNETSWRIETSSMQDRVTGITVSPSSYTLTRIGQVIPLQAHVQPASAANPAVSWSSSNEQVATVSPQGVVTAKGNGSCIITATSTDGTRIQGTSQIQVNTYVPPTSITISPRIGNVLANGSLQFSAKILPPEASSSGVVWSSSNPKIATINQNGLAIGRALGSCKIIARTQSGNCADSVTLEVSSKTFVIDPIPTLYPNHNTPWTITHSAQPAGVPQYSLQHQSGMSGLVSLEKSTLVVRLPDNWIPNQPDLCTFQVTGQLNDIQRTQQVQVSLGNLTFKNSIYQLCMGVPEVIVPEQLEPSDATVSWNSPQTNILTFSDKGWAQPVRPGRVQVIAQIPTGLQQLVDIVVVAPTLQIIGEEQQTIYENQQIQLQTISSPAQSTQLHIQWEIRQGNDYVSLSDLGLLTGLLRSDANTVTIRASYKELPQIYDEVTFTVRPVVSASLTRHNLLNTSIYPNDRPIPDYPNTLLVDFDHSPLTGIHWKFFDSEGLESDDLQIDPDGTLSARNSAASGTYTLRGYDDTGTYTTEGLPIYVYRYLEYEVGLAAWSSSMEADENKITYTYSMQSRWESTCWDWLYSTRYGPRRRSEIFYSEVFLHFPEQSTLYFPISGSGTENRPSLFVQEYQQTFAYNPQFSVWDDLTAASFVYDRQNDTHHPGLRGGTIVLGEQEYYYLRQSGTSFYNAP